MSRATRLLAGVLAAAAALAAVAAWQAGGLGRGQERVVEITARQFSYTPKEIRVGAGDRVRLILRTVDVTHGLGIRAYGINLVATPGDDAEAVFVADRPGRFPIYCTVYCGTGHPEHEGFLVVEGGR